MDDAANTTSPNTPPLFQQTWTDETPLDQIPEEHRERVRFEREQAAETAKPSDTASEVAASAAKAAGGQPRKAGARTAAKAPKKGRGAKPGARPRREAAEDLPEAPPADTPVVLMTSKVSDETGRFVARRRVAMATEKRAGELILREQARKATADEVKAAGRDLPVIR